MEVEFAQTLFTDGSFFLSFDLFDWLAAFTAFAMMPTLP